MQTELVDRARRGDREAFGVLAGGAVDRLYAIARLILRDTELAEDATQEALVRAWRDLPSLRDVERFDAWLYRLIVRACADVGRDRRRWRAEITIVSTEPAEPDRASALADRDELERGLRRLSEAQQTILVMHFYVGLSPTETADALDIPVGTAKSRLHYAIEALRAAIAADERSAVRRPAGGPNGMNANHDLERRLADFYETEAPPRAPEWVLESALATIDTTQQRRVRARAPRRAWPTSPMGWLATAAAVAVAVGGISLVAVQLSRGPASTPTPSPSPTPTLDPATMRWAPARLEQDWPVPVRSEPPEGAPLLSMGLAPDAHWDEGQRLWGPFAYADPVGEVAVGSPSWTDIKTVRVTPGIFSVDLAGDLPGVPDPAGQWIAYGVVLDTDGRV